MRCVPTTGGEAVSLIIKLEGKYLQWFTVSDGPGWGMTLSELKREIRREEGARGIRELEDALKRVEERGTSARRDDGVDDTIWNNRAGPWETPLHREEIVEFFVRRLRQPTQASLAAFREGLPLCSSDCVAVERDGRSSHCVYCWGTGFMRPVTAPQIHAPSLTEKEEEGMKITIVKPSTFVVVTTPMRGSYAEAGSLGITARSTDDFVARVFVFRDPRGKMISSGIYLGQSEIEVSHLRPDAEEQAFLRKKMGGHAFDLDEAMSR